MNKRRYIVVSHSCGTSAKDDPYTELAAAVLMQAVDDYIEVLKKLLKGGLTKSEIRDCEILKKELERFFYSQEYEFYTAFLSTEIKEELERFFYSQEYEFYTAFLSTEIDPQALIKNCPIRAKERLEEEKQKEEEKAKKAAEKAAQEQAEKAVQEQQPENNNRAETQEKADKAESEESL